MVSNIGTSIIWPMPVRARASRPASKAFAAAEPTMRSIAAIGMKRGCPGGPLQQHRNGAGCLDQVVVGGLPGIAPRTAVADHAEVHDRRVDLADGFVIEAKARECSGADVRGERIHAGHQAQHRLLGVGLLEVDGDAALAAGVVLEAAAHAVMAWHPGVSRGVALRRFDLDHVGTEIGDDAGCTRGPSAPW